MVLPDRRSVNFYTSILSFDMKESVVTTNTSVIGLYFPGRKYIIEDKFTWLISCVMILRKLGSSWNGRVTIFQGSSQTTSRFQHSFCRIEDVVHTVLPKNMFETSESSASGG